MNDFIRTSQYGLGPSGSEVKKIQEENVYNHYGKISTTKHLSAAFRSIPREKKG